MNITDVASETIQGDKLKAIFNRQKELMNKYHDIELRSGLLQTEDCPVNLNDKKGQARIKDFSWRVTEELGEALDAWFDGDGIHTKEELADGLHFLTELSILAGFDFNGWNFNGDGLEAIWEYPMHSESTMEQAVTVFISKLGMTCNCLKNKPWKQSQMLTDIPEFNNRLFETWVSYINIMSLMFDSPDEIVDIYFKKSNVNKFRQRSGY